MSKRAERRHHDARIEAWYRKNVATRWAGKTDGWAYRWKWTAGQPVAHEYDPEGFAKREAYIERTAQRLANHNKCPCQICKRERYDRRAERWDWEAERRDWEDG